MNQQKVVHTHIPRSYSEVTDLFWQGRIVDFDVIKNEKLLLTLNRRKGFRKPNCKANVTVLSYITSMARIELHKHICKLHEEGAVIYKVACDAIFFTFPSNKPIPCKISPSFGHFKLIYDQEIFGFLATGTRSYTLLLGSESHGTKEKMIIKSCGLSLSALNLEMFSFEDFCRAVNESMTQGSLPPKVVQFTTARQPDGSIRNLRVNKSILKSNLQERRCVNKFSDNFSSVPYGFQRE